MSGGPTDRSAGADSPPEDGSRKKRARRRRKRKQDRVERIDAQDVAKRQVAQKVAQEVIQKKGAEKRGLRRLREYFPAGVTESERHLMKEVFVLTDEYRDAIEPIPGSPRILVGKKGTGKTAILDSLASTLARFGVPVVSLKPDDIALPSEQVRSVADAVRFAHSELVLSVAAELGRNRTIATSESDSQLINAARRQGARDDDLVERLYDLLIPVGKAVGDIDFSSLPQRNVRVGKRLERAVKETLLRHEGRFFFLLLDDIDDVGEPSQADFLVRIWGMLLALRKLNDRISNLKIIVTMRSEIWMRLKWDPRSVADKVDHFDPLVYELVPNEAGIERIIFRRIQQADGKGYESFFEGESVVLPTSAEKRRWSAFLAKNSRGRPRYSINLIRMLIDEALANKSEKISSAHVDSVMPRFSAWCVSRLAEEYHRDCPRLQDVILSWKEMEFVEEADNVLAHLQKLPSRFRLELRGETLDSQRRSSIFGLWHLLHEIGFINGLVHDIREPREFRNINFSDDPKLVAESNWVQLSRVHWEVHPTFRSYLLDVKQNETSNHRLSIDEIRQRRRNRS